jgi:hypothetical protein
LYNTNDEHNQAAEDSKGKVDAQMLHNGGVVGRQIHWPVSG